MSDRDLSASPPLSEQQVEQIRAFILTHGTRSLPSKAKVRDLCDSHERLRAQVSTLTDRAASSDVEAWGVFQDGVACVVAFPYQTRAEEFAARQADDALGAHTYTVAPLVRASTRSRRSEQEADTLIDAFAQAFGDCVECVASEDREGLVTMMEKAKRARAALRTALVEPSTDAGEGHDSGTYGELPAEIRALIPGYEWDNMSREDQRAWLIAKLAESRAHSATDAGEDARRDSEPRQSIKLVRRLLRGEQIDLTPFDPEVRAEIDGVLDLVRIARAAAPGVSPEVSNG